MRAPPTLYDVVVMDGDCQLTPPSAAACSMTMMIDPEEPHQRQMLADPCRCRECATWMPCLVGCSRVAAGRSLFKHLGAKVNCTLVTF
jgi:hypothetical protein